MTVDAWAREDLERLDASGLRRSLEPLDSPQGAVVWLGGRALMNFSSNDYLGLANHPEVVAAAHAGLEKHGMGTGASRLIVGDSWAHRHLEAALAEFEGTEAALLFNSGWAANVGVIPALVGPGDVIFSDALNHASIVDGCRLSRAQTVIVPHRDVQAFAELMPQFTGRRKLVVTDSVFSMDGDLAPLRELQALCKREGAALMVDEAHATGVLGPSGGGLCEALGVTPDLRVGTLSKSLGCSGAYVAASRAVCDALISRARSLVFSTALPASVCAAAMHAVRLTRAPELRAKLWANIRHFSRGLSALGLSSHEHSPIFSLVLGSPEAALAAAGALRARGLLVKAIRPPTVPPGTSRLRVALSASHEPAHLDALLSALRDVLPRTVA